MFLLYLSSLPHYQAEYLIFRKWPIAAGSTHPDRYIACGKRRPPPPPPEKKNQKKKKYIYIYILEHKRKWQTATFIRVKQNDGDSYSQSYFRVVELKLSFQNPEFKILEFKILNFQNLESRILAVQNPEFRILTVQNPEFRILTVVNSNSKS